MPDRPSEDISADAALTPGFLDAPKNSRRRRRVNHTPGMELTVVNPEIKEVLSVETGAHLPVEAVIGSDYSELIQLRMRVRTAMHKEQPLYRCSICGVAVYLCCGPKEQRFFFKHRQEDGNCPAITRGTLSQAELNARKYNGAKESKLHLKMKEWLAECLRVDSRFDDIAQETRWTGALTGAWRRPDVRATYNGTPVAFEVQLSTTYLNVIAERRLFYLEQGALLFWIFAEFDCELRRMTEDDVFYNNNQNAFIVNAGTVADTLTKREFVLECVWAEPLRNGGTSGFHRKRVSFHELTLDPTNQQAFYFDFEGRKRRFKEESETETQTLRRDFEAWWGARGYYADDKRLAWLKFWERFRKQGIVLPLHFTQLDMTLITALYSAKNNEPWGQGRTYLVEVAHQVANAHKEHLKWFMHAVRLYGRLETMQAEGTPQKWKDKHEACLKEYAVNREPFRPVGEYIPLVELLFPELCPLPV